MNTAWLELVTAAFSGGIVVKLLDYAYAEYLRRSETSATAKEVVNRHLDPILKAADELVGKLRSLAEEDFKEFRTHKTTAPPPIFIPAWMLLVFYTFSATSGPEWRYFEEKAFTFSSLLTRRERD